MSRLFESIIGQNHGRVWNSGVHRYRCCRKGHGLPHRAVLLAGGLRADAGSGRHHGRRGAGLGGNQDDSDCQDWPSPRGEPAPYSP